MKFSFKSPPRKKPLSTEERAAREQMLRTLPDELLGHIRGGLVEAGCHPKCTCGGGGII